MVVDFKMIINQKAKSWHHSLTRSSGAGSGRMGVGMCFRGVRSMSMSMSMRNSVDLGVRMDCRSSMRLGLGVCMASMHGGGKGSTLKGRGCTRDGAQGRK